MKAVQVDESKGGRVIVYGQQSIGGTWKFLNIYNNRRNIQTI
jgi:hypothetical protein